MYFSAIRSFDAPAMILFAFIFYIYSRKNQIYYGIIASRVRVVEENQYIY